MRLARKARWTRYYTSEFLGKSSADDIYEKFQNCGPKVDPNKLPHVNLSFLNKIHEKRSDDERQELIYLGT